MKESKLSGDPQARILGLDLLRILSMVMIIGLHMLGQGGILSSAAEGSGSRYAAVGMQCLFYCAVDCYGLLSGYVSGVRRHHGAKLLLLWLEVVLYSLLFAVFFRWRYPQYVGRDAFVNAVLPVLTRQYWYFTGYFGLALVMPLLEGGLAKLESRRAVRGFFLMLLFLCLLPTLLHSDAFHLRGGYSMLWLLLLYLMGAALRRGSRFQRVGAVPLLLTAAVCYGLTLLSVLRPMNLPYTSGITLLNYTSPTVALFSACLLLLFSRLRGRGGRGEKLITGLGRCSFGVYILHTNPLLWYLAFRHNCLKSWAGLPAQLLVPAVLGAAVGAYLVCAGVDGLRLLVFRLLRLQELAEKLFERLAPSRPKEEG